MPLVSNLFTKPKNQKLEDCLVDNAKHIPPGSFGEHVKLIQIALNQLSSVFLKVDGLYGFKTAAAVVKFKEAQAPPLRQPGQAVADNIVGINTIKALDEQMRDLEKSEPLLTGFISLDANGSKHEHSLSTACDPFFDSDDFQGRISHHGTPINPQRLGRMITIGGTNDAKYLGFENFVPDPSQDKDMPNEAVHGRPFTNTLGNRTVSDVSFRSSPIDKFMKIELKRIAMFGCRLTFASNIQTVVDLMPFLLSLGPQLQFALAKNTGKIDPLDIAAPLHVVVIKMVNLF